MKKIILITSCIFFFGLFSAAQTERVPVFISGTEGYKIFRIPAIISLKDGTLLAFAEGRVNGGNDFGDINIVMKRSSDNGITWSTCKKLVDYDTLQAGNPAPVVDMTDKNYPDGRIFLFYNTGNKSEAEVRRGKGLREVWYITSTDGGSTWSEPINITAQVHRPKQPNINTAYNFQEDWREYANTPGHAIQFANGKYKGRIYVIANHSAGEPQKNFTDYDVNGFYTDDHGKTFHLSQTLNVPGSNECMAAELSNNKLMVNARNQKGSPRQRIIAISSNGGEAWDSSFYDANLPDPVCQGSLLNFHLRKHKPALAFCNDNDIKHRDNLTLRISKDEGKTWDKQFVVDKNPADYKGDFTAYSDIVQISKKQIGVLYEFDNYKQIVFKIINFGR